MKVFRAVFTGLTVSCTNVPLTGRKQFTAVPPSQLQVLSAESYEQALKVSKLSANRNSYLLTQTRLTGMKG